MTEKLFTGTLRINQPTNQEAVDVRLTWTDCDEAGDYVVPNVLSPRDLASRPDNMDETVLHTYAWVNRQGQSISTIPVVIHMSSIRLLGNDNVNLVPQQKRVIVTCLTS